MRSRLLQSNQLSGDDDDDADTHKDHTLDSKTLSCAH